MDPLPHRAEPACPEGPVPQGFCISGRRTVCSNNDLQSCERLQNRGGRLFLKAPAERTQRREAEPSGCRGSAEGCLRTGTNLMCCPVGTSPAAAGGSTWSCPSRVGEY